GPATGYLFGDSFAKIRIASRRTVVRPASAQRLDARLDDVLRSIKIGFADFEMDDVLALALEFAGAVEDFECSFSSEARHALSQPQFELDRTRHKAKRVIVLPRAGPVSRSRPNPGKRALLHARTRTCWQSLESIFCPLLGRRSVRRNYQ